MKQLLSLWGVCLVSSTPSSSASPCSSAKAAERGVLERWLKEESEVSKEHVEAVLKSWGLDAEAKPARTRLKRLMEGEQGWRRTLYRELVDRVHDTESACFQGPGGACARAEDGSHRCVEPFPDCYNVDHLGDLTLPDLRPSGHNICTRACSKGCPKGWRCDSFEWVESVDVGKGRREVKLHKGSACAPGARAAQAGQACEEHYDCDRNAPWCFRSACRRECARDDCTADHSCVVARLGSTGHETVTRNICFPMPK